MSKSTIKKGFTLLEVLCSLGIFSIIFISIISYEVTSLNIKNDIKNINNNVSVMEALKNYIIYSMTFEELEQLQKENRTIVNKENMTLDKILLQVANLFSDKATASSPYMQLNFMKYESKVYTLKLSMHSGTSPDTIKFQCNFYKGCHK